MEPKFSLLLFRNEVKTRYAAKPHVYHQLVQLLSSYNSNRIDISHLKAAVELLLQGNDDLIEEFNSKITLSLPPDTQQSHMFSEKSREFIHRVKERYEKQPRKYKLFISILRNVTSASIQETCAQVEILFHDEPQLLEEFEELVRVEFLNKEPSIKKISVAQLNENSSNRIKPTNPSKIPSANRLVQKAPSLTRASSNSAIPIQPMLLKPPSVSPMLLGTYLHTNNDSKVEPRERSKSAATAPEPKRRALSIFIPARAMKFFCGKDSQQEPSMRRKKSTSYCQPGVMSWKKGKSPRQSAEVPIAKQQTSASASSPVTVEISVDPNTTATPTKHKKTKSLKSMLKLVSSVKHKPRDTRAMTVH